MAMDPQKERRGFLCAGSGAILWGFSGTVGQYVLSHYSITPLHITSMRMFFGGLVLLLVAALLHWHSIKGLLSQRRYVLLLLAYALPGLALSQFSYYQSIDYSNAGTASVLCSLSVVMMSIVTCIAKQRAPSYRECMAIGLAVAGVGLLSTKGDLSTLELSTAGVIWGLISAVGVVIYSYASQEIVWKWGSLPVNALGLFVGGLFISIFIQPWDMPSDLDMMGLLLLSFVIFVGTDLNFVLFSKGIASIGPIKTTLLGPLEPLTAAIISAVWLGTVFGIYEIIGFICIIMTIFLVVARFRVGG